MDLTIKHFDPIADLSFMEASPSSKLGKLRKERGDGPASRAVSIVMEVKGLTPIAFLELYPFSIYDVDLKNEYVVPAMPKGLQKNEKAYDLYCDALDAAIDVKHKLLALGIPLDYANLVLPRGLTPTLTVKINYFTLCSMAKRYLCMKADMGCREFFLTLIHQLRTSFSQYSPLYTLFVPPCELYHGCVQVKGCGRYKR